MNESESQGKALYFILDLVVNAPIFTTLGVQIAACALVKRSSVNKDFCRPIVHQKIFQITQLLCSDPSNLTKSEYKLLNLL